MKPNKVAAILIIGIITMLFVVTALMSKPDDANATVIMVTNPRQYTGLSTDTKSTLTAAQAGAIFTETDTGLRYLWNGSEWGLQTAFVSGDTTVVFAPTTTDAIYCRGYDVGGFLFKIANINTSVTMILQGKVGESEWSAVDVDSTVYTSNGNEGILTSNAAAFDSLRLKFESEAGGSDAEVTSVPTLGGVQ